MLIEGEEEKRREDPRGAALANTGWLARGYYRRKEREGQVVGSRVVWCILGVGKQGWGCGGDGWMDGYPPSRKKKKVGGYFAGFAYGRRGMDAITRFAETTRNRSSRNAPVSSLSKRIPVL